MTRTLKTTALVTAVLVSAASSSFAMNSHSAVQAELKFLGYSDAVVSQLSSTELNTIEATMNNGSDSDARQEVRTLMANFSK